jgi:hypothetical protein
MARNALAAATIEDGEIKLVMIQTAHSTVIFLLLGEWSC